MGRKDYTAEWEVPLFNGDSEFRSEYVGGQLLAIMDIAKDYDLDEEHNDVLIDVDDNGYYEVGVEKLREIDLDGTNVARADLEYENDQYHIGASYFRIRFLSTE